MSSDREVHISIKKDAAAPQVPSSPSRAAPLFGGSKRVRDVSLLGQNAASRGLSFRPKKAPKDAAGPKEQPASIAQTLKNWNKASLRRAAKLLTAKNPEKEAPLYPNGWTEFLYLILVDSMRWLWVVEAGNATKMRRSMTDPGYSDKRYQVFSSGSERSLSSAASRRTQSVSNTYYDEPLQSASQSPSRAKDDRVSLLDNLDQKRRSLGMNRLSLIVLCLLFLLGLREATRTFFPQRRTASSFFAAPAPFSDQMEALFDPSRSILPASAEPVTADVTAVLLNWKRLASLKISVEHLCQFAFIKHIVIQNNNPDIKLSPSDFSNLQCHPLRLRIHNSLTNELFLARHLACANASTLFCLHLDDEYFFASVRSLYSAFKSDPNQLVVVANSEYSTLYQYEWRFPNPSIGLDAQFAWLGYGSFVSKEYTQQFLDMTKTTQPPMTKDELALADNYFATFMNKPVTIVESALQAMDSRPVGFSDGSSGLERNKVHIDRGLSLLVKRLQNQPERSALSSEPLYTYQSACASDRCRFISNVQSSLPSSEIYPVTAGGPTLALRRWEERRGYLGTSQSGERNWTASADTIALQKWATTHPASFAVDEDLSTAWLSPFPIQKDDFVGLALLSPFKPASRPSIRLELVAENDDLLLPKLAVEISSDGKSWRPAPTSKPFTCASTKLPPRLASPAFPLKEHQEAHAHNPRQSSNRWMKKRHLKRCCLDLKTTVPGEDDGWSYVRLRVADEDGLQAIGWVVYELGLTGV